VHALAAGERRCTQSLTNGANGASRRAVTTSTSCSVASAGARVGRRLAPLEPEAGAREPHVPLRHVGVEELHERARRRGRVEAAERGVHLALHRGQAAEHPAVEQRPLGHGGSSADGVHPKFAYWAKNAYTFFSVTRKLPAVWRMAASSKRRGTHTWLDATRKRRTASAPWRSITSHGLTTLPFDFDILRPSASSTRSLTITAR
jgi:hypothetical protein